MSNSNLQFSNFSDNASSEDINKIDNNLHGMKKGRLKEVWDQVLLLYNLVKDPNVSWGSKAIAIGALLYVISPLDAVPDFTPFFGLLDDVTVVAIAISSLSSAISEYKSNLSSK